MYNTCRYSTEWQPYIGDYDKFEYDIKLKDGTIVLNCYPNAGQFNSFDPALKQGSRRSNTLFATHLVSEIRFSASQILDINPDEFYQNNNQSLHKEI